MMVTRRSWIHQLRNPALEHRASLTFQQGAGKRNKQSCDGYPKGVKVGNRNVQSRQIHKNVRRVHDGISSFRKGVVKRGYIETLLRREKKTSPKERKESTHHPPSHTKTNRARQSYSIQDLVQKKNATRMQTQLGFFDRVHLSNLLDLALPRLSAEKRKTVKHVSATVL